MVLLSITGLSTADVFFALPRYLYMVVITNRTVLLLLLTMLVIKYTLATNQLMFICSCLASYQI